MNTYISLLRGINVSGQKLISMSGLRNMYESLGFQNVRSYIQSGNVVFETKRVSPAILSKKISEGIKDTFGFDVAVLVRTPEELTRVLNQNPFPGIDTSTIYVTFLEQQPGPHAANELKSHQSKSETFVVAGREIYLHYPDGYGKTKLTNALIEKKLNTIATTRNWRTITTLLAMAAR